MLATFDWDTMFHVFGSLMLIVIYIKQPRRF